VTRRQGVDQRARTIELEVLPGLEEIAQHEVQRQLPGLPVEVLGRGRLWVRGVTDLARLERLRTVVAAYVVVAFAVPRPRALLGQEHFDRLGHELAGIAGRARFTGLRLAAAGAESSVMRRLGAELAVRVRLPEDPDDGDLVVRLVRDDRRTGWEARIRTTPRPLGTRPWRVRNFPGSLNATIAAGMVRLAAPQRDERAINLLCGAGTIAIEHLQALPRATVVGLDIDATSALPAAAANARAARVGDRLPFLRGDAMALPFPDRSWSVLYCDLPYGDKVGSNAANEVLYPAVLDEAARVAVPGARFVVITHDIARFERFLSARPDAWGVRRRLRVFQGGHQPEVFVLARR
jgi:tRNA (guanine6-N2)-methyltransferase